MTYQDDPNLNRPSHPMTEEPSYTGWIVGAVVALAVILGIFAMSGPTDQTNTASRPTPTTTGSGVTTPAPAPVQPTNPASNTPAAPGSTR